MNKKIISIFYLLFHPLRMINIISLYSMLKGKYRATIILSHAYREYIYRKINQNQSKKIVEAKNSKFIINIHDGLLRSGGLTDRLKGICTLYNYAKKHNYNFKLYFDHPFYLNKYLLPNLYDWTIEKDTISYNLNTTALYTWENEVMSKRFFDSVKSKNQLHINCNSNEYFDDYSQLFNELFKPSLLLQEQLDAHLDKLGGEANYISISFRFQNLLGEFKEANSKSLPEDRRNQLIEDCIEMIDKIKKRHHDIENVLITSDSNIFRQMSKSKYSYIYTYIFPNEIGHLDYSKNGKIKELTAFLDMFLISKAKKAYQVRSKEMYNSDFPKLAAKMNNKEYEMILINRI